MDQDIVFKKPGWLLRPAKISDYDAIAAVWHESASLPGVAPIVMPTASELRERLDVEMELGWQVTIAERDGEVIGFAAIKYQHSVLDQLFVRPEFIGKGLGRALLEHCRFLMPEGFALHTATTNARACAFYLKAGLSFLGCDTHPRTGHPISLFEWKPS